jgi:hypothetical protein
MEQIVKYVRVSFLVVAVAASGCGESTPDPVVPTSPTSGAGQALKLTPATPVAPSDGGRLDSRQPTLVVNNPAAPFAPDATLSLRFVVEDEAGLLVHASTPVALGAGTTSYALPLALDHSRTYRWYAETIWGESVGASTVAHSFSTPEPPPAVAPATDACPGTSPHAIVACQRGRFAGHMDDGELVDFLRAVAVNLNQNGVGGGPYGVLWKRSGNNCHGYSCDIICAGHGGGQRQYDVLLDIEGPQHAVWDGPHDGDDIRVDVCEIP